MIGLAGQNAAVDENLTGLENLEMVGRLYHVPAAEARRRGEELLERFELTAAAQPDGQDVLGRHASAPGPRREPGGPSAGPVPGRAHDRPRPTEPARDVGHHPRAREGGDNAAADDAVPRRGGPSRRQDRRDRPRQGDRRGNLRRAQGPRRRRGARAPGRRPRACRRGGGRGPGSRARAAATSTTTRARSTIPVGSDGTAILTEAVRRLDDAGDPARRHRAAASDARRRVPVADRPRRGGKLGRRGVRGRRRSKKRSATERRRRT